MSDSNFNPNQVLWGVPAIAAEAGVDSIPACYKKLERGHLPGRKVGGKWVSTRDEIRAALTGQMVAA